MHWKIVLTLLFLLLAVACSQDENGEDATPSPEVETPAATATARPTATPRPTPTVTPTPEPPQTQVDAVDQAVDDDGEIVIRNVFAPEGGWVVVYADDEGAPGEPVGHAAVAEGEQSDVVVAVDPFRLTPTLHVRLHQDTGEIGTFEFPEADEALELEGEAVADMFEADLQVTIPAISVADQALGTDGQVVVDGVTSLGPGWVAIHADNGGELGPALGQSSVPAGESSNVVVRLPWRSATRELYAVLWQDGGEAGIFEPGQFDEQVAVNEQPVQAAFAVELPPDVYVINQPVVTDEIVVEQAFINEPGWIAVYSNFEGFTDRLLGYTALEAGSNELVQIPIAPQFSTNVLHILLHEDGGVEGEFEYPAGDPPLRDEEGRPLIFSFQADSGNYVVTEDQALGEEDTVRVPLVVADLAAWVVVYADADGAPGDIIGQTFVERGVQRDVEIDIDPDAATETLYVVLHRDAGVLGEFEPTGPDDILQREREPIQAPFRVLGSDLTD